MPEPTTDELFERVRKALPAPAKVWTTEDGIRYMSKWDADRREQAHADLDDLRTRFEQLEEERDAAKALLHSSVKEIADDAFRRGLLLGRLARGGSRPR